jgi:endoglucanase
MAGSAHRWRLGVTSAPLLWLFAVVVLVLPATPSLRLAADRLGTSAVGATARAAVTSQLPLHTSGRWIVSSTGQRVKLAAVNWYGADQSQYVVEGLEYRPLAAIAATIRSMGFNTVRLPFSNEMVEHNPVVAAQYLTANPGLKNLHARTIFDRVIDAMVAAGMVVVLDDHISDARWCCNAGDDNGLWWNSRYSAASWLADWVTLAHRYAPGGTHPQPGVVGAELRNEPRAASGRGKPVWTGTGKPLDWAGAATRAGNAILAINPNWLIVVDGLNFSLDLTGVRTHPIVLSVPHQIVYAAHDYYFSHQPSEYASAAKLAAVLTSHWGYLAGGPAAAPVWVSEFGAYAATKSSLVDSTPSTQGFWFQAFLQYLRQGDYDWAYWPVNGTRAYSAYKDRHQGDPEWHGVLASDWLHPRTDETGVPRLLQYLQGLMAG